ncbi:hypothetical protein O181_078391 [Austropuccinia psidii MF-1]|uniref:Uncharacterized protein n=1 Tax=Austropuccinia psidii MF-1 TaxID=1389203 RepID=A0A9Q3ID05_9BASI|nr:hypothetical protein [Austropuccinia psidii MF-1]
MPPFVEPSQTNEPPIPGPSPSSKSHVDVLTHEPEPELAPIQSMEEPFVLPRRSPPAPSSPHSHEEACQEFTDLEPTLMIPQAIIHKSINQILLENFQLLHITPFMDVAH